MLMLVLTSGSLWLTFWGLASILLSAPLAIFFYRVVFKVRALGILNGAAAFVIIGIGVDDVFVFINIFRQANHLKEARARTLYTIKTAGKATFFTSFTTAAAFAANIASMIPAVHDFGLFMALIVANCWITVMVTMPPVLYIWYISFAKCEAKIGHFFFRCLPSSRVRSCVTIPDDIAHFMDASRGCVSHVTLTREITEEDADVPMLSMDISGTQYIGDTDDADDDEQLVRIDPDPLFIPDEFETETKPNSYFGAHLQGLMYYTMVVPFVRGRWVIIGISSVLLCISIGFMTQLHTSTKPPRFFKEYTNIQQLLDLKAKFSTIDNIHCFDCSAMYNLGKVTPSPDPTEITEPLFVETTTHFSPIFDCPRGYFPCKIEECCLPNMKYCDGIPDCKQGTDEPWYCRNSSVDYTQVTCNMSVYGIMKTTTTEPVHLSSKVLPNVTSTHAPKPQNQSRSLSSSNTTNTSSKPVNMTIKSEPVNAINSSQSNDNIHGSITNQTAYNQSITISSESIKRSTSKPIFSSVSPNGSVKTINGSKDVNMKIHDKPALSTPGGKTEISSKNSIFSTTYPATSITRAVMSNGKPLTDKTFVRSKKTLKPNHSHTVPWKKPTHNEKKSDTPQTVPPKAKTQSATSSVKPQSVPENYDVCKNRDCTHLKDRPLLESGATVYVLFGVKSFQWTQQDLGHVMSDDTGTLEFDDRFSSLFNFTSPDILKGLGELCSICKKIANNTDLVKNGSAQCLPTDSIPSYIRDTLLGSVKECQNLPKVTYIYGSEQPAHAIGSLTEDATGILWLGFAFESTTSKGKSYFEAYNEYKKWDAFLADLKTQIDPSSPLIDMFQASEFWPEVLMEVVAVNSAIYGVALSLIICMVAVMIFTGHLLLLLVIFVCIIEMVCLVVAIFYVLGWEIGGVEAISLSILVGSSVDYCVHLVEGYVLAAQACPHKEEAVKARKWRTSAAFTHIGVSIISSALTTIIAAIPLTQTTIQPFAKFGQIIAINTSVCILYSLTVCTALLSTFAPAFFKSSWASTLKSLGGTVLVVGGAILLIFGLSKAGIEIPGPNGNALF